MGMPRAWSWLQGPDSREPVRARPPSSSEQGVKHLVFVSFVFVILPSSQSLVGILHARHWPVGVPGPCRFRPLRALLLSAACILFRKSDGMSQACRCTPPGLELQTTIRNHRVAVGTSASLARAAWSFLGSRLAQLPWVT